MWRSNVFHLPVRGNGDGGIYTTVADVRSLWLAFFDGRIVSAGVGRRDGAAAQRHLRRRSGTGSGSGSTVRAKRCGWKGATPGCHSEVGTIRRRELTHTVIANDMDGAWPMTKALYARLSAPTR